MVVVVEERRRKEVIAMRVKAFLVGRRGAMMVDIGMRMLCVVTWPRRAVCRFVLRCRLSRF